ncbi:MAG: zinc-dependent alcohol dehydrogenase family protein [Gammaproteobacteria bacterium]
MQAVQMQQVGGPEVLQLVEMAAPEITAADQIKVQLRAAGINPIDTKIRSRGVFYEQALPAVLGCDGAGIVTAVGDDVTHWRPGDEVWFCHGGLGGAQGNYAEVTVLPAALAQPKPARLDFVHAAAGPLVLITAWEALFDRAVLQAGQSVLIHAGAGGVGHVAIQLAKLVGARVCTTVGSHEHAEFVRQLGADEVIDYQQQDFVAAVLDWTDGQGVDVALEAVGARVFQQTLEAMAVYGNLITLLDPGSGIDWSNARTKNLRIGFELMLTPMLRDIPTALQHHGEILQQCAQWIDAGKLRLHVSQTWPLAQAAEAHRQIEAGHTQGKLVLTL